MINLDYKFGGIVESVDIIKDGKVLEHKVFNKHNTFLKKGQEALRKYFGGLSNYNEASNEPCLFNSNYGGGAGVFAGAIVIFRYGSGNTANTDSTIGLEAQLTGVGTTQKTDVITGYTGTIGSHTAESCLYPVLFPIVTKDTPVQEFGVQFSGFSQFITRVVFPEAVIVPTGGQLLVNYKVTMTLPSIAETIKTYTAETSPFVGINLPCSILMDNPLGVESEGQNKVPNLSLFSYLPYSSVAGMTAYAWSDLFTSTNAYDKFEPTDPDDNFGLSRGYSMFQGRSCIAPTKGSSKKYRYLSSCTPLNSICPVFGLSDLPNGELAKDSYGWILKGGEDATLYPRLCPWSYGGSVSARTDLGYRGAGDETYTYDTSTVTYQNQTTETSLLSKAIIRPNITEDKQVYWIYFNGIMVYFNGESFTLRPDSSLELNLSLSIS